MARICALYKFTNQRNVFNVWTLLLLIFYNVAAELDDIPETLFEHHPITPAPEFLPSPANVTFRVGELAVLRCTASNLGAKTVIWRRTDSSFPLTVGVVSYVADDRIQISHADYNNKWDLMIKNVQPEDEGVYECQITSRDETYGKLVSLTVLDAEVEAPKIQITGKEYVERDGSIDLQCKATGDHYPPDDMDWFKDGNKLSSNAKVFISKRYSVPQQTFTSNLNIARARMVDSGTYICLSSNMQIASIKVHVFDEVDAPDIQATDKPYEEQDESIDLQDNVTAETLNIKRGSEKDLEQNHTNNEEVPSDGIYRSPATYRRAFYVHILPGFLLVSVSLIGKLSPTSTFGI